MRFVGPLQHACELGVHTPPMLLYRKFRAYNGDVLQAARSLASGDREWLDAERAKLEADIQSDASAPPPPPPLPPHAVKREREATLMTTTMVTTRSLSVRCMTRDGAPSSTIDRLPSCRRALLCHQNGSRRACMLHSAKRGASSSSGCWRIAHTLRRSHHRIAVTRDMHRWWVIQRATTRSVPIAPIGTSGSRVSEFMRWT